MSDRTFWSTAHDMSYCSFSSVIFARFVKLRSSRDAGIFGTVSKNHDFFYIFHLKFDYSNPASQAEHQTTGFGQRYRCKSVSNVGVERIRWIRRDEQDFPGAMIKAGFLVAGS